jgi:hypothetical protein
VSSTYRLNITGGRVYPGPLELAYHNARFWLTERTFGTQQVDMLAGRTLYKRELPRLVHWLRDWRIAINVSKSTGLLFVKVARHIQKPRPDQFL